MTESTPVRAEDVLPVRSRISWGAIFAGLFTAVSVLVLLYVLGAALGLTWNEHTNRTDYVASGAAIWAAISALIALFAGGLVTSLFTAGENKAEAVLYGIVLWGLTFAVAMGISIAGARLAIGGALTTANTAANFSAGDWERFAKDAGVNQDQINRVRSDIQSSAANATITPEQRTRAAWWTFIGTVLSMIAAVCGTLAGSGPTPYLRGLFVRRTVVTVRPRP